MKVQLTDEDMQERGDKNYFDMGVHEVVIESANRGVTTNGKDYVEFKVLGSEDQTDTVRLWFTTEKSAAYATSILAGIAVHNKASEADKSAVREAFKKVTDTDQIDDKFLAKFKGMDAWFRVSQSDRTYTAQDGSTKFSYDKDIAGYPLKVKAPTATQTTFGSDIEPLTDASSIPF